MTTRSHEPGARTRLWLALLALVLAGASWAQGLPPAAAEALQRGQSLAAQAQLAYPQHFPDQPLWAAALAAGQEAAAAAPDHHAPQRFLAQVYGRTNWHVRAWEAWQRYRQLGGQLDAAAARQLVESALWLGISAFDRGWDDLARTYLETVVELAPDEARAHERLARLAVARGEPAVALPHLTALGDDLPEDLRAALEAARLRERFGPAAIQAYEAARAAAAAAAWGTALERYQAAAAANPAFVDAWRGLADAALTLGRPGEAVAAWERVLELEPGDPAATASLALARDQLAFGVAAQQAFQRGLDAYRAGTLITARTAFQAAIAQNPRYVDAFAWLGRIAAETGDLPTAVARYRSASALAPGRADLRQALAQAEARLAQADVVARAEATAQAVAAAQANAAAEVAATAPAEARAPPAVDQAEAPPAATQAESPPPPGPTEPQRPAPGLAESVAAVTPPPAPAPPASPNQLPLVDRVVEHRPSTSGGSSAFTFLATPGLARDLSRFVGGHLHLRLEVRTKPTDAPILYQLCLVQEDITVSPACTTASALRVTGVGRFVVDQPLASLSGAGRLDWHRGLSQVMLVIRQPDGSPIDDRLVPGQGERPAIDPNDYYPMTVSVSAVLVAPGTVFSGWP